MWNSDWLNGRCSDVYKCLKSAVGLQNTAKYCKQTGPSNRLQTRKRTPHVVLKISRSGLPFTASHFKHRALQSMAESATTE